MQEPLWPPGPGLRSTGPTISGTAVGVTAGWQREAWEALQRLGVEDVGSAGTSQPPSLVADFDSSTVRDALRRWPLTRVLRWSFDHLTDTRQEVRIEVHYSGGVAVLAEGACPVLPHSEADTVALAEAVAVGLVAPAWQALRSGISRTDGAGRRHKRDAETTSAGPTGRSLTRLRRRSRRLLFGAVGERSWRVGRLDGFIDPESETSLRTDEIQQLSPPSGVRYISDPLTAGTELYVEAYSGRTGLGQVFEYRSGLWSRVPLFKSGHFSYPFPVDTEDGAWLLPEMASVGAQKMFSLDGRPGPDGSDPLTLPFVARPLQGMESVRLADATLLHHQGHWYLFAGVRGPRQKLRLADCALRLFVSESVAGPFTEHPCSPILVDPNGARMAGQVFLRGGQMYRPGQDNSTRYGAAVVFHWIEALTPEEYRESRCGAVTFVDAHGPHTVSADAGGTWLDWYEEVFTPVAGWNRLLWRVAARRQSRMTAATG